ncbi:LytTR family DNA-binding domain-containing protein [Fructobacillus durionis]|nr:LytTR family DNA-binding domain-containing protein [Fructobacillus durionis]
MKVEFITKEMPDGEVEVTVAAAEKNQQVARVINALSELEKSSPEVLSFKTEEGIQLIKIKDIIYIDVSENDLLIYTKQELMVTKGRLSKVLERIKNTNFVQVSKHAAVNINHLDRLENSFSGSMLAKLSQGNETMVSRRYVKKLIEHLGV